MNEYYVYVAKEGRRILYIGHGIGGRHSHVLSGCSHVYGLNKLHFEGADIKVEILHDNLTKKAARELELDEIKNLDPEFNVVGAHACVTDKLIDKMAKYIVRKDMNVCADGVGKHVLEILKKNIRKWLNGTFILFTRYDTHIFRVQPNFLKSFIERFPEAITIRKDERTGSIRVKFSEEYLEGVRKKVAHKGGPKKKLDKLLGAAN